MDSPLVSIFCLSYNHGAYLKRAFDSFDMQQLDAPIEIVIHDDASTDGSDKIIREYASRNPNVKAIIQKENQYTKHGGFSFLSEIPLAGKYVAVCEGDDYWTDPQKLSRQVAYLEAHPNCSLVFHPVRTIRSWEPNQPDHTFDGLEERDYSANEVIKDWRVPAVSVMYRREYAKYQPYSNKFLCGDLILALTMARYGKLHCLADTMAVYYKLPSGMVRSFKFDLTTYRKQLNHYSEIGHYFPEVSSFCKAFQTQIYCTAIKYVLHEYGIRGFLRTVATEHWMIRANFYKAVFRGVVHGVFCFRSSSL